MTKTIETGLMIVGVAVMAVLLTTPAHSVEKITSDWPCIQAKVENLTATQMWDGPPIDAVKDWWNDKDVNKLVPGLVRRRTPIEEAEKSIEEFAKAIPEAERDKRLTVLFAGVLDRINSNRRRVVNGIEKYQQRQRLRSDKLEQDGIALAELEERKAKGEDVGTVLEKKQKEYDWDARVFKERQDNVPIACEIPVLIEQRIFSLARAIRNHMSN